MDAFDLLRLFCPPCCAACRSPCATGVLLCESCVGELNSEAPVWGDPPPGVFAAVSSFRHEGPAADLLRAFKFGRMAGLAPLLAGYMAEHVDPAPGRRTVVAVPPAGLRRRTRGFDPAGMLAGAICRRIDCDPPASGLIRRVGTGRQRGRGRQSRLADPPRILPAGRLRGPVLLVDDVITTGATVSACAAALKRCGAGPVIALSFTRRL